MTNCTFAPFSAGKPRMLMQSGGEVLIRETTFANCTGGAIMLMGGDLVLHGNLIRNNTATTGAGMLVHGGRAWLTACLFESNFAERGGALCVDGGRLFLGNRTSMVGNGAQVGASISVEQGALSYSLPTPLTRYLFTASDDAFGLTAGSIDVDFPFSCPGELLI